MNEYFLAPVSQSFVLVGGIAGFFPREVKFSKSSGNGVDRTRESEA